MKKIIFLLFASALFSAAYPQSDNFIRGVDLSYAQQIEDLGGKYKVNGVNQDVLDIFKNNGANYVRLRLWHTPPDGYNGLAKTVSFAKRVKAKGLKLLLDIHYSDSWADPGKQTKPAAWTNLSFAGLKDSVYSYTKNVITSLKNQNALPDMVQIGNEINNGMLWPSGQIISNTGWQSLADLLKNGINGVKDAAGSSPVKIMIHFSEGANNTDCIWFFNGIINQNVQFDVIGLSFYPWSNVTLSALQGNLNDLATRYGKEINIAETAYPWTLAYQSDNWNNIYGLPSQLLSGYPATVQGQLDFIKALSGIVKAMPNSRGNGFFYWEPDWITVSGLGSSWENMTLFDFGGEVLNSIAAFNSGTSAAAENNDLPSSYKLFQNYPNPFNPATVISYQLPASCYVSLKVFDVLGKEILTLADEFQNAGTHKSTLSTLQSALSSGIYFYQLRAGSFMETKKFLLMK